MLGVAVWGLGTHATAKVLPALAATPGIRIVGVCSRAAAVVLGSGARYGCAGWLDPEPMLRDDAVDAVFVATPSGLHFAHGRAVLGAGKHLWCEKPIVETSSQADELVRLSRERSVVVAEAFMYLYHPQFAWLKRTLASGRLGALRSLSCRFGIPPLARHSFRLDPKLGGGAFLDLGSYLTSLVAALLPFDELQLHFAEILTAPAAPVDTSGRAVMRCGVDLAVTLEWRSGCAYRNEIDLWGTDGCVAIDHIFSKPAGYLPVYRFRDMNGREETEQGVAGDHFIRMFEAFRALSQDVTAAEAERQAIVNRADILSRIRDAAGGTAPRSAV